MGTHLLKSIFLISLVCLTSIVTYAHDFEVDGIYYNITDPANKEVAVTYKGSNYSFYDEYSGKVVIPAIVTKGGTTYSVTSIGDEAFHGCSDLTSVTIPNSVTSIGEYAFRGCSSLTSVTIPNSVTSIGNYAFAYCRGLTSVTIGNSVTSIEFCAFKNCDGLTSITIPNSVTNIGDWAFEDCSKVESLYISSAIETIGEYAFAGCTRISEIQMASKKAITANENIFSTDTYNNATLYVPVGSKSDFEETSPWKNFYIQEKDYAGIEDIVADDNSDEQIEYFNLNGVRVENPQNGIFIRRQGNKVEKVIVK